MIIGSGASISFGLPSMSDLATHLQQLSIDQFLETDRDGWIEFCNQLSNGADLESALHQINLSSAITDQIVNEVWELVKSKDELVFYDSLNKSNLFPLGKLLSHMFQSSNGKIDIVTTNYDRLIEYACDQEQLNCYTAFSYGFTKWLQFPTNIKTERVVNIWKVHGSIDWFKSDLNESISLSMLNRIPNNYKPLVVTPGVQKYQNTHLEPYRTIIGASDQALENASSFLCFGFGFNDEHIQPKLISKCQKNEASIVIVTKKLSDKTIELIESGSLKNYVAIECDDVNGGSVIHIPNHEQLRVAENYWSMDGFLNLVL